MHYKLEIIMPPTDDIHGAVTEILLRPHEAHWGVHPGDVVRT